MGWAQFILLSYLISKLALSGWHHGRAYTLYVHSCVGDIASFVFIISLLVLGGFFN